MGRKIAFNLSWILLLLSGICWAGTNTDSSTGSRAKDTDVNSVQTILEQLRDRTAKIQSYQAEVEYRYRQPLLESESVRRGLLYYARFGQRSKLRVNFQTLKQDDEEEQKYVEHFIFDGVWLTYIDYETKQPKMYQLAEPNKPVDAFELASKNLPIIGFTKIEDLKKHFEIKLVEPTTGEEKSFIQLHLKTSPASIYKDRYSSIDFWIDRKLGLPAKVIAVTTEPEPPSSDIYEIRLLKPKVNQKIDDKVFESTIPQGFSEPEVVPLKRKTDQS